MGQDELPAVQEYGGIPSGCHTDTPFDNAEPPLLSSGMEQDRWPEIMEDDIPPEYYESLMPFGYGEDEPGIPFDDAEPPSAWMDGMDADWEGGADFPASGSMEQDVRAAFPEEKEPSAGFYAPMPDRIEIDDIEGFDDLPLLIGSASRSAGMGNYSHCGNYGGVPDDCRYEEDEMRDYY